MRNEDDLNAAGEDGDDHAVRVLWYRTAGGNCDAFSGVQRKVRVLTHPHRLLQRENGRNRIRTSEGVAGANRIAVHGGAVKIRNIFFGGNVLRQDSSQGIGQGNQLRLPQRGEFLFYQCQNLLRCFHIQHVKPPQ